jgi:lipoprotein-anchoring transpeptidase ErfK/SrfK
VSYGAARAIGVGLLLACGLVGFAAAFGVSTKAGADTGKTVTSTQPPTTTEPPPTEPPPPDPPSLDPAPIAFGVWVGNVSVGGLMPSRAATVVKKAFVRPLVLVVGPAGKIRLAPGDLGARPNIPKAIRRARVARPGASVPLDVDVSTMRVRNYAERLGRDLDLEARDARVKLKGVRPFAVPSVEGRRLQRLSNAREIRFALKRNSRAPIRLAFDVLKPKVVSVNLDRAIVILRDSKKLLFFADTKFVRWFGIATGQASYPTPLGTFEIVTLQRNPWWYPPPSPWAADANPVPPGPGNPLGTRWMGLSEPYVGIHGTPDSASIGYSASHGCIRMRISEAEWLFQHVKVGTPVFIISR